MKQLKLTVLFLGLLQSPGQGEAAQTACNCESKILQQESRGEDQRSRWSLCASGIEGFLYSSLNKETTTNQCFVQATFKSYRCWGSGYLFMQARLESHIILARG